LGVGVVPFGVGLVFDVRTQETLASVSYSFSIGVEIGVHLV